MFETIVALATAPMKSAIAVIRLSGDNCFEIVNKSLKTKLNNIEKRTIHHTYIIDNNKIVDDVVLLFYVAPNSFTGENCVEVMCHGSMIIVDEIISLFLKNGARMATNGEFSSRAYLNNKIDLLQAEAINDLINSETIQSKDLYMHSLSGATTKIFIPIKTMLADLLSQIEVNIDYPEYLDIEQLSIEQVQKVCSTLINQINELIIKGEENIVYKNGINIAIVGSPNAGKSSILNCLLKEDKAIVTNIAGTTRDVVEGVVSYKGVILRFFDTAGYRHSDDVIEQIGVEKTIKTINEADLILNIIDERGLNNEIIELIKNKKVITIKNKSDLEQDDKYINVSAIKGDITPILDEISSMFVLDKIKAIPSFANTRQIGLLKEMQSCLKIALEDCINQAPVDIISVNLLSAYNCALDLLGESNKNDLTKEIFSRFCVGK